MPTPEPVQLGLSGPGVGENCHGEQGAAHGDVPSPGVQTAGTLV